MAEFKYYLKDPKSTSPTPVRLHVHYDNRICKVYISEKVDPKYWPLQPLDENGKSKKREAKDFRVKPLHPNASEFNRTLREKAIKAESVYMKFKSDNDREPTIDELKHQIKVKLNLEIAENITFFKYFQSIIDDKQKNADREGISKRNTVIPSYELTLGILREFQRRENYRVDWETINMKFYNRFMDYMKAKGLKANTRGLRIKYLRAVLRKATANDKNKNLAFTDSDFKTVSEEVNSIYLDETELKDLYSLELSPARAKIRDVFMIACYTGLRISDVKRITRKHIRGGFIHITTQKTGAKVVIPQHPFVDEILRRYDYNLPRFADQYFNRQLKEIGKVLAEKTEARPIEGKGKYSEIRLHTGRRSFCTNMYRRKISPATIMKISGHKTETEFFNYIKITSDEHAQILNKSFNQDREMYKNASTLKAQ